MTMMLFVVLFAGSAFATTNNPVIQCSGVDSINCTKLTATTCVTSDPSTNVKYAWYGDGLVSGQDQPCAVWNMPGPKTVYVTDLISGGQSSCVAEVIRTVPLPDLYIGCNLLRCDGQLTQVSAGPFDPNVTVSWSGPGVVSNGSNQFGYFALVNQAGVYTALATNNVTGCTNSAWCEVMPEVHPKLTCSNDGLTCTKTTSTTTVNVESIPYALGYLWSGDGLVGPNNGPTAQWNAPGPKKVVVTILNSGCADSCTTEVRPASCDGHMFPTQTTCDDFTNGTATELSQICYKPENGKVTVVTPGVFFYYTMFTAPSASFCVYINQSKEVAAWKYFGVHQGNQAYVYTAGCAPFAQGSDLGNGLTRICVTGATAGNKYVIRVKYTSKSIEGSNIASDLATNEYKFWTTIGGSEQTGTRDSITVYPNCSAGASAFADPGDEVSSAPEAFKLGANFPNPFNPTTQISFDLADPSDVRLSVYNMLGQEVATLVQGITSAGTHHAEWNATGHDGAVVPSGVYVYRIQARSLVTGKQFSDVKKMLLMK
jgi:hypothetical protein